MIEAKGHNGTVRFDGQTVIIAREGIAARLTHGGGEKHILIGQISAVQLKMPGALTNGFIQFSLPGAVEGHAAKGHRTAEAGKDENSVLFTPKQKGDFVAVRDAVEQAIAARFQPSPQQAGATAVDRMSQLTALVQSGMISQQDYEAKRAEILGQI